jgi:molecular chaperone HtpG
MLPNKFKKILEKENAIYSRVLRVIELFKPILVDNKLYFFEEFTDHGLNHIESVLRSSEFIISDSSYDFISAREIEIIVLSVILHDIGMHTEFSTFTNMISGKYDQVRTSLDSKTWNELWDDYLAEVKRFSTKQKINILGDDSYIFREPDLSNKDKLDGADRKIIGEFIRRHHARLAHEIALLGIIGSDNKKIDFTELYKEEERSLIGITARSHGMNLRSTFPYLNELFFDTWSTPHDIKIIFPMIVLRIADYIQIDSSRVDRFLLRLKTFNSPISKKEFDTHLAIDAITFTRNDQESFYVKCSPKSSEMYVKLNNLLNDIQKEMDLSWAVIGEVYGFILHSTPRIKFRRLTSNLHDKNYLRKLLFHPEHVKIRMSDDLSKLLVAPLYGNRATFGVRELLQNSIDACRERTTTSDLNYAPEVSISFKRISPDKFLFTIADNGKGMNIDEIKSYFLNVGSSFRKSLSWKKAYVDDAGKTLIKRNGKFGVGVLAAFLLGDEIKVTTRRYDSNVTYHFTTGIDSEFIEIKSDVAIQTEEGTRIEISVSNDVFQNVQNDKLKWTNWYISDDVKVSYDIDETQKKCSLNIVKSNFNFFSSPPFPKVGWNYVASSGIFKKSSDGFLACNDICILSSSNKKFSYSLDQRREYFFTYLPNLLIDDPEGVFPVRLDRNDIDCSVLPFEDDLLIDLGKHLVAFLLTIEFDDESPMKSVSKYVKSKSSQQLLFSKSGYTMSVDYFLEKLERKGHFLTKFTGTVNEHTVDIINHSPSLVMFENHFRFQYTYSQHILAPECGGIHLVSQETYSEFFNIGKSRISKSSQKMHSLMHKNDEVTIYRRNNFIPEKILGIDSLLSKYSELFHQFKNLTGAIHILPLDYLKNRSVQSQMVYSHYTSIGDVIHKVFDYYFSDNIIIPYNFDERKIMYAKAFKELSAYMQTK